MTKNIPLIGLAAAMSAMMLGGVREEPSYHRAPRGPRPKSTHKRKHKGSKAAKKASQKGSK